MRQYRWYSNIKWGPHYNPEMQAHHAKAEDVGALTEQVRGIDLQCLQVLHGDRWSWVTETPVHLGGISHNWYGEPI